MMSAKDDYYTLLRQRRAKFRMQLTRMMKGPARRKDDERASVSTVSSCIDMTDDWITEEDKNLLRYYHYILHEVDDARAGTLDSDTLKKITSMVATEWQERHHECFDRLIRETKRDYVTSMKKSIVDFVLREPFEEVYELGAPVSESYIVNTISLTLQHFSDYIIHYTYIYIRSACMFHCQPFPIREIADPYSPERSARHTRIRGKLERRSISLYHPCIRKAVDHWHREYGLVPLLLAFRA